MHACLEEAVCHVDGCKIFTSFTICKDVRNLWKWEAIRNHVCIELAVIVDPAGEHHGVGLGDDECSRPSSVVLGWAGLKNLG